MKLCFRLGELIVIGYSYMDFVDDHNERKSSSGHVFLFGSGTISWSSQK